MFSTAPDDAATRRPAPNVIVSVDDAAGLSDADMGTMRIALRDGFSEGRWLTGDVPWSERRGLGVGLGAVRRLMNDVRVLSSSNKGLVIEAVLWRKPGRPAGRRS